MSEESEPRDGEELAPWIDKSLPPLEKYLEGKRGVVVESTIGVGAFRDLVELYGGQLKIYRLVDHDLLDDIKKNHPDFIIIHNYLLRDKEILLAIRKTGIQMALIRKGLVPEEQREEYLKMHEKLKKLGVQLGNSVTRWDDAKRFLERIYKK
jgi:hypothetical protein